MIDGLFRLNIDLSDDQIGDDARLHDSGRDGFIENADVLIDVGGDGAQAGDDVFVIVHGARRHLIDDEIDAIVKAELLADAEQMGIEIPGFEARLKVKANHAFGQGIDGNAAGLWGIELREALFEELAAAIAGGFRPVRPAVVVFVAADAGGVFGVVAQQLLEGVF